MKQMLFVNELILWNPGQINEYMERILWIDSGGYILYVIDALSTGGLPKVKRIDEIISALENGEAEKADNDPVINVISEEDIKDSDKLKRDYAWTVISDLVAYEKEPGVFDREKRGPWISLAVEKYSVTYATVYKYLRRYWQRGKNKNALLPDYYNSGGRGKRKKLGDKKIGRPRKNIQVNGPGVNVNEATKKIFRVAINKYMDTPKENYATVAYNLMVKEFYNEDYRFEDGIRKSVNIPIAQIPTITQFRYWYEVEQDLIKSLTLRKGKKKFALQHRASTGKSDADIIGPGSKYQIDATIADVYLISRFNKDWIIGRPIIYSVIDCFSRMITGIYVGLEGPSWIGAMMALANAFSDKVSFCKEYNINIESEDWPCFHTPQAVLGDRGEMESIKADTLVNGLDIRIENTPSYRADWKGIVEQCFHLLDEQVKPLVPGHIDIDFRERGGTDYRLDAKITIFQFTQIIIKCVLKHNNEHWMKSYETDEMMIEDDVDPIPRELWIWGIVNRSGKLKSFPKDTIKLNLMPTGIATVTENGIKFKKMFYSCNKAIDEQWFEIARNKGSWKEKIAFEPRNMDYIYIKSEDGKSFIKCAMIDKKRYGDKTLDEINYLLEYDKLKLDRNSGRILQSKIDLLSEIESIIEEAENTSDKQAHKTESNASRTKNIRVRRKLEKEDERLTKAFVLDEKGDSEPAKVIPIRGEDDKLKYPSNIEYLRKKQRERMGKQDE